ncbi:MAG: hypothetical protein WC758_08785, partial [Candidatus Woesearchaeota archaeon]
IPLVANKLDIAISNPGPSAIYNIVPKIYFDEVAIKSDNSFDILMPFQTYKTYIDIPFSFLGAKTPEKVKIVIEGEEVVVATNKTQVVIYNLLFIFVVSIIVLLTILIRLKKWKFPRKHL